MEELLFDPQTSGGLLIALSDNEANELLDSLRQSGIGANIVGEIIEKDEYEIYAMND